MFPRIRVLFYALLFLFYCLINPLSADETSIKALLAKPQKVEYSNEELPMIIIAYNLFCARNAEFECLESNQQNVLMRFGKNIDALPGGISTGLAFTHMAFIVQNNVEGHFSGFLRIKNKTLEESSIPYECFLFVTTPIESFNNRVIVILSAISPEQTTIFSVDNKLNVELLYNTLNKNNINNKKEILFSGSFAVMRSIFSVRVEKPGVFLLEERRDSRDDHPSHPPVEGRKFIIDVSKGAFELVYYLKEGVK